MNFDTAFDKLLLSEGGFQKDPKDPGNWADGVNGGTKYGISKRAYPGEDIPNMTLARAKELYKRDYWGPAGCDALPARIKFDVFDMAVNSGVKRAILTLQKMVGTTEDGILGPKTLQAVQRLPVDRLLIRFNAERLIFMTELSNWPAFSRGWARRIAANLKEI